MSLFHIGAIAALFFFTWKALFVAMFLWWVSGSLGIGMAYHRLLTHRGYKTPKWVEYFLTVCATLALEGGPISGWLRTAFIISFPMWTATRIRPSTVNGGRIWAGSLMGKSMHHDTTTLARYVPDPPKISFMCGSRNILRSHDCAGVALLAVGGLPFLMWASSCAPLLACTRPGW